MTGSVAIVLSLLLLSGCSPDAAADEEVELTVSVAASLREVAEELATRYMAGHPDITIRNNTGASGALQQQILNGAGVDIFLPAAMRPMRELVVAGRVDSAAVALFARNELVLIARHGSNLVNSVDDLSGPTVERVAVGTPASVPAGDYAVDALRELGLWEAVEQKAVFGSSVRQVLAYVELGEVDAGIVYSTDAGTSDRVRVVVSIPLRTRVEYPVAILNDSEHPLEARRYLEFLLSPQAGEILTRHGFEVPDA